MSNNDPKELAKHLRRPEGEVGINVAEKLNSTNIHITTYVYDRMQVKGKEKVLEIGFGNGKLMPLLLDKAPDLFIAGIDYSETMVAEGISHLRQYIDAGSMELKTAPVSSIPYGDNTFDKVCTINTLYFWDSPLEEAAEVLRVLKPGGTVYIGIRPKEEARQLESTRYGFTLYEPEEAAALLLDAGFAAAGFTIQKDPSVNLDGKEYTFSSCCVTGRKG